MEIGVSSYSFRAYIVSHEKCTYFDLCDLAKKMGFDGIEFIDLDSFDGKLSTNPLEDAPKIKAYCEQIGLKIFAYTIGANLLAENVDEVVKHVQYCVDVAAALGAPVLRHDLAWGLPEGKTWEDMVDVMVPHVRAITEYAAKKGIRTCSENHGFIYQNPERVKAVIQAVNNPNYGWLVDIGNFLCTDCDSLASVKMAAPYAFHVHAKDFKRIAEGGICTPANNHIVGTIVGKGVVPVKEDLQFLKAGGYQGRISLEFEGPEDCLTALQAGHDYLREVLG